MYNILPAATLCILYGFLSLCLPLIVSAQSTCGDIVSLDPSGAEERTPIDECENPFNADDPVPFDVSFTLNDESITEGAEFSLEPSVSVVGEYTILKPDNFASPKFSLYRASSSELYQVVATDFDSFTLDTLQPGDYTAVFVYEELIQVSQGSSWLNWVKNLFVPITQAFFDDYLEVVTIEFTVVEVVVEPAGASSVLFLPGIQASRLYKEGAVFEDQLWEPLNNGDIRDLEMTGAGESVQEIYTRDVIQKIFGIGGDVYKQFIDFLTDLEDDEVIADFRTFPYDWRYSVVDIVENGTLYGSSGDTERVYPTAVLQQLANESLTGQVTIVAHSNGGLLAKAIMADLEANDQADLVDNIVLIGSPQLGTPKALATILHGYEQQIAGGFVVDDEVIRDVIVNMPGAYGLLPSAAYFDSTEEPVITFVEASTTTDFITEYGAEIDTIGGQTNFMAGTDGRGTATTIESAAISNESMLDGAADYHANELDSWDAPTGVNVVQVAGVGVETEIGFRYEEFTEQKCITAGQSIVCTEEVFYKPYPVMTPYGDETVVANSAVGYGEGSVYFFNLFLADEFRHSNLTESKYVQKLVSNVLFATTSEIELISESQPLLISDKTIIGGHSPIRLLLEDTDGNRLGVFDGEIVEDIPRAHYRELAGSKYLIVPNDIEYNVTVFGEAVGGATITLDNLSNPSASLIKVPIAVVTSSTSITFSKTDNGFSDMMVDVDGDGMVDQFLPPDGSDPKPPEPTTYATLATAVKDLNVNNWQLKQLFRLVKRAEKFSEREARYAKRIERLYLRILNRKLIRLTQQGLISHTELEMIQGIIEELKSM